MTALWQACTRASASRVHAHAPGWSHHSTRLVTLLPVATWSQATGLAAAASFKHVSPAGAAVAVPLSPKMAAVYEVSGRPRVSVRISIPQYGFLDVHPLYPHHSPDPAGWRQGADPGCARVPPRAERRPALQVRVT